jgi:AcrR family transcriptional regulator
LRTVASADAETWTDGDTVALGKTAAGARGNRRGLSAAQIVEVATRICDKEGLDALTIRRLAADLDVGNMTLYSYFRSKDDILDGIADHVLGNFTLPPAQETSAEGVLQALALAFLQMMREHPSIVQLLSTRVTVSQKSLKFALEMVVGRLRDAGFPGPSAIEAYGAIMHYTLGFASYQAPRPWGHPDHPDLSELRRQRKHFYASLPISDFPNLVELADLATVLPTMEQFLAGLSCLTDGLLTRHGLDSRSDRTRRARSSRPPRRSPNAGQTPIVH